jgi:glycosyltransferase involved in cell wall biosynthesis
MTYPDNVRQKRIAIFLPGLYDGGAQRVMLNLADGLISNGFNVDIVLVQAEGSFLNAIPSSARLIELNTRHFSGQRTLISLPALVRYIRKTKLEAMISSLNYVNVVALLAKKFAGVPFRLIISEHNTISTEGEHLAGYFRWVLHTLMKINYPKADGIVAVSEGVAEDMSQVLKIPREKISVIYNPIITPDIQAKKNEPLDDSWFGVNQPPVILAIGRLTKQKGFDVLIKAFSQVRKKRAARLLILGEGEERQSLLDLAAESGVEMDVRLPGFVSNPYQYLSKAALFVLSSRWEGLPTVLVEALYCGTRLVSTDCPSGPREILKNGLYGQLVPVEDADSLAKAMLTALDDEQPSIPSTSWQAFDLNSVIQQYIGIIIGNK